MSCFALLISVFFCNFTTELEGVLNTPFIGSHLFRKTNWSLRPAPKVRVFLFPPKPTRLLISPGLLDGLKALRIGYMKISRAILRLFNSNGLHVDAFLRITNFYQSTKPACKNLLLYPNGS